MSENEEIVNYIKRAFELKSQECYKQAIEMLYKALAIEPENPELLYQVGDLYFLLHNYPRAIQYPEQILAKDSNHIPSLKLLKNIYIKQDELIPAKELAEKVYELEPLAENLIEIIKLCGKLELLEDTDKYIEKINTDDKCLYEYANALYLNSKADEAEKVIKKALELNPNNTDCIILSGKMLFDENKLQESKEIFDKLENQTQNPEVLNYKGLFALEEPDFIEAIKYFSKASNLNKTNPKYLYNLGNAYFLNGWKDEAIGAYKKAICLVPANSDYRYSLAYLYYAYNEFEKAQKEVDFILENNGKHYQTQVLKALLLYKNKNYLAAESTLLSNVKNGNDDDFTLSSLARIEMELGKFEAAEKHLNTVITRNPEALNYLCDLGEVYIKEKKYEAALELAAQITETNSNYISGYILGANAALLAEEFDTAKAYAQDAISLDINCAEGYYYLAMVRFNEKDYEEAIECMKRAITFDVSNARYYAKMAEIYKASGDNKTAFEYVKEAETIDDSEEYKILYKEFAALNRR